MIAKIIANTKKLQQKVKEEMENEDLTPETFEKLTSLKQALKCHPIKLRKQRRDIHNKIDLNKWLKKSTPSSIMMRQNQ